MPIFSKSQRLSEAFQRVLDSQSATEAFENGFAALAAAENIGFWPIFGPKKEEYFACVYDALGQSIVELNDPERASMREALTYLQFADNTLSYRQDALAVSRLVTLAQAARALPNDQGIEGHQVAQDAMARAEAIAFKLGETGAKDFLEAIVRNEMSDVGSGIDGAIEATEKFLGAMKHTKWFLTEADARIKLARFLLFKAKSSPLKEPVGLAHRALHHAKRASEIYRDEALVAEEAQSCVLVGRGIALSSEFPDLNAEAQVIAAFERCYGLLKGIGNQKVLDESYYEFAELCHDIQVGDSIFTTSEALEIIDDLTPGVSVRTNPHLLGNMLTLEDKLLEDLPRAARLDRRKRMANQSLRLAQYWQGQSDLYPAALFYSQSAGTNFSMFLDGFSEGCQIAVDQLSIAVGLYEKLGQKRGWIAALGDLASYKAELLTGNWSENIEEAIQIQTSALTHLKPGDMDDVFVRGLMNLAFAYRDDRRGYREDNIELAIAYLEDALNFAHRFGVEDVERRCAEELASLFEKRPRGTRGDNAKYALNANLIALEHGDATSKSYSTHRSAINAIRLISEIGKDKVKRSSDRSQELYEEAKANADKMRVYGRVFEQIASLRSLSDTLTHWVYFDENADQDQQLEETIKKYQEAITYCEEAEQISAQYGDFWATGYLMAEMARIWDMVGSMMSIVDMSGENAAKSFNPHIPLASTRALDAFEQAASLYEAALKDLSGYCSARDERQMLVAGARLEVQLRDWRAAAELFRKASSSLMDQTFQVATTHEEQLSSLREANEIASLGTVVTFFALGDLRALEFNDGARTQLLAKTISAREAVFDNSILEAITSLQSDIRANNAVLEQETIDNRHRLILEIREKRRELTKLQEKSKRIGGNGKNLKDDLSSLVDDRTALLVTAFSHFGGMLFSVWESKGETEISSVNSLDSFEIDKVFNEKNLGWDPKYERAFGGDYPTSVRIDNLEEAIGFVSDQLVDILKPGDWFWRQDAPVPKEGQRLIVVPDGYLAALPMVCMPMGHHEHLIDHCEITLTPSISHGARLRGLKPAQDYLGLSVLASQDYLDSEIFFGLEARFLAHMGALVGSDWVASSSADIRGAPSAEIRSSIVMSEGPSQFSIALPPSSPTIS